MHKQNFKDLEKRYNNLWQQGKKKEAQDLVELAAERFPEEEYTTYLDLAVLNLELGNHIKAKKLFGEALDRGYWFPEVFIQPIFENKEFAEIASKWKNLRDEAEKDTEAEYLLYKPDNYDLTKEYPLFIALHGWGENIEMFSQYWKSKNIAKNYFLLLPQSSQIIGSKNFCWNDQTLAIKEIKNIFARIKEEYNINSDKVIMGGFSQGAALSIDMILAQSIPLKGFVSLCPPMPREFGEKSILNGLQAGCQGVIITGDQDPQYADQQKMISQFKELNFPVDLIVKKGLGHWFPDNLAEYLDKSLNFINGKNS